MSVFESLRFTLAQVNPVVGDLPYNSQLVMNIWDEWDSSSDLIIFPEMVTTGYPPEDLLCKASFLSAHNTTIETLTESSLKRDSAILIGAPYVLGDKLYNAAFLIDNGKILSITTKHHLPNYGIFDEKRYFTAGTHFSAPLFRGKKLGVMICEDMWFPNVAECLKQDGADLLISINGSPFDLNKNEQRIAQAQSRVAETGIPLIYVNQVGGQDDLAFDGSSFALNKNGDIITQCSFCLEDIRSIDTASPLPFSPIPNEQRIFDVLVLGLKDYMQKTGQKKVLIGLSGGVDSALVAAIAVDALGAENTHAVMMPSEFTSQDSLDDAAECAKRLGISYEILPIKNMVDNFIKDQPDTSGLAHENLQSRLRGLTLMTKSNMTGAMVLSTGNKSEMAMGYATLYGDMCGGYNPLKDVYKTQIYKICAWLNSVRGDIIPHNIMTKAPSAELRANQKDQDSLPPYEILDAVLELMIEQDLGIKDVITQGFDHTIVEKVSKLLHLAEYKRRQAPPGTKISTRAFAKDRRYPISNGYKA